ncbi:hypothetical protein [Reinekea sp.]|jgi:hypothetical protein|uniref:hypothetical protein n=1 Tax=Reinekea sp. TaxID=1970455 RepID=UPI003988F196
MIKHKYIKLIEFAISQDSAYHMQLGLDASKMSESEFKLIRDSTFLTEHLEPNMPMSYIFDWKLKPEAIFGYLSYMQYEHSDKSSKRAMFFSTASLIIAIASLAITVLSML